MKIITVAIIASIATILLVHAMDIGTAIAITLHPSIVNQLASVR